MCTKLCFCCCCCICALYIWQAVSERATARTFTPTTTKYIRPLITTTKRKHFIPCHDEDTILYIHRRDEYSIAMYSGATADAYMYFFDFILFLFFLFFFIYVYLVIFVLSVVVFVFTFLVRKST